MAEYRPAFLADMLKESIRQGTTPSLTVTSNSMSPLLRAGDQVGLQEMVPANTRQGQIITFSNPNYRNDLITHRLAGTFLVDGELQFATYGDRTLLFDYPVSFEDVVGVVVWRRRNGQILDFSRGKGASLNRKLAKQSVDGLRRATGLRLDDIELDRESILRSNKHRLYYRKKIGTRFIRRANYFWASILESFTEHFPSYGGGNQDR